jgi:type II secretory pathway pseudopilin PulG
MRTGERGWAYLGLLMLLALLGTALAEAGVVWRTLAQREREAELRFRGEQIREAIGRYRAATAQREWPPSLEALLEDRRGGAVRHHLRRLWADPFTGAADWVLLPPSATGQAREARETRGIAGVQSRAAVPRLTDAATPAAGSEPRVSDWRFVHTAAAQPIAAPTRTTP